MSTFVGADVAALRQLSVQLLSSADELESLVNRLGGRVNAAQWRGPDSERFRGDWSQRHVGTIRNAASALRSASEAARTNAAQQETASSADTSGSASPNGVFPQGLRNATNDSAIDPSRITPAQIFELSRIGPDFKVGPWSAGDLAKMLPISGIGDVLDVRDIADKLSHSEVPVHEVIGVTADAFKSMDNPLTYLIGTNIAVWDSFAKAVQKTDFSPTTFDATMSYIQNNPADAIATFVQSTVGFLPELISDVSPGWKLF